MVAAGKSPSVALVGPVLPYRGGIAQHTTMLHRELQRLSSLTTVSFNRQYPALLFPGSTDIDPDHRDYREPGVTYTLDSLNPLTWRRVARELLELKPDLVIIPWWTVYWAPLTRYLVGRLKRGGIPVLFICHNVSEHESAAWKNWLARRVLARGSHFLTHTAADAGQIRQIVPDADVSVHAHPVYRQFPPPEVPLPRRRGLELLFYGFLRPYKGLDILISAMGLLRGRDIQLTVAGEIWSGGEQILQQIQQLGIEGQVELIPRYQSEAETARLFARADAVVLPYRSATGSGVVAIAYHYRKPVIVTDVGGLPEVVREGETGFIVPAGDAPAMAQTIARLDRESCAGMGLAIRDLSRGLNWEGMARKILERVTNPPATACTPAGTAR